MVNLIYEQGRASVGFTITSNTSTSATVNVTATEPLMVSPFVYADDSFDTPGLIGINNLTYQCTLVNMNRVLSNILNQGVTGIALTNITTNLTNASIQMLFYSPPYWFYHSQTSCLFSLSTRWFPD